MGWTLAAISQHLGLDRKTVRKFRNATTAEELINGPRFGQPRSFEEFVPYLRQRVAEDQVVNAAQLYAELRSPLLADKTPARTAIDRSARVSLIPERQPERTIATRHDPPVTDA
ncbi:hypothetical protein ACIBI9_62980 [Nonomuraea sp. NPDC050451]|uniref:hypothetical protein n=1 Tax=Nonomuraea sp. NPDC050451 TaxID=3364364 RepID=UPI0037AB1E3A